MMDLAKQYLNGQKTYDEIRDIIRDKVIATDGYGKNPNSYLAKKRAWSIYNELSKLDYTIYKLKGGE